jgi:hypothetical protein
MAERPFNTADQISDLFHVAHGKRDVKSDINLMSISWS